MAKLPRVPRPNMPRPQMEVYSSGHAKSWIYNALPGPVTTFYSLVMAGSITGLTYFFANMYGHDGQMWSMIAIGVMTVIGLIIGAFRARKAKREQEEAGGDFESALKGSASGWGDEVSDPGEIARLDDLRNNFQQGIDTFRAYGRDVYSMPWYVIMGEPGSGKSEAIRRSELKFPEALQDKLQGTGGTYSMHWWFTNHAIILDTAGAMLTSPEAAGRFEEFLKLLKTHRPDCPINGMVLTIPTDSLLQDPPPVAEQKAKVIANQLAVIQKALDVRFPIYIMVSKSDRLPGFREYFDAEGQASFERQMMGWSNPDPLGTPFDPARIAESLDTIAMRLQSRALALLADPISPNPGARRMDEVDSLYGFPNVIRSLAPRLRLYLNVLFQTGAWSAKPPFFRGIYFTSALREGGQLDQVLAQALGMPLNQLPPGGIFAREKSVFLRDVFMEKIFLERGLVTRLADVGAHLRKRLMTFYGATAALLVLALVGGLLVKTKLAKQLEDEQVQWSAANSSWDNGTLLAMVKRTTVQLPDNTTRPQWVWAGADIAKAKTDNGSGTSGKITRLEHLKELKERTDKRLPMWWFFWPVWEWRDFLHRREEGYLTVFEASAMKPLLDAARERILWDTAKGRNVHPDTQKRLATAYVQLLQLETWINDGINPSDKEWQAWFRAMLDYVCDEQIPGGMSNGLVAGAPPLAARKYSDADADELANLATAIYAKDGKADLAKRDWMVESPEIPEAESAIVQGQVLLLGTGSGAAKAATDKAAADKQMEAALSEFSTAELALADIEARGVQASLRDINLHIATLQKSAADIDRLRGVTSGENAKAFESAISTIESLASKLRGERFQSLLRSISSSKNTSTVSTAASGIDPVLQNEIFTNGAYRQRLNRYEAALGMSTQASGDTTAIPFGQLFSAVPAPVSPPAAAATDPAKPADYAGPRADKCQLIADKLLPPYKEARQRDQRLAKYHGRAAVEVVGMKLFPLFATSVAFKDETSLKEQCKVLADIAKDRKAFKEQRPNLKVTDELTSLEGFFTRIDSLLAVAAALYDESTNSLRKINVSIAGATKADIKQLQENAPPSLPAPNAIGQPGAPALIVKNQYVAGLKAVKVTNRQGTVIIGDQGSPPQPVNCSEGISVSYTLQDETGAARSGDASDYNGQWGLLKSISKNGMYWSLRSFSIQMTIAGPDLPEPSHWPRETDIAPEMQMMNRR